MACGISRRLPPYPIGLFRGRILVRQPGDVLTRLWDFTPLVPRERRNRLLAIPSFDEVISRVTAGTVDYFNAEPRKIPPGLGCSRGVFRIRVRQCDYDALFNSPVGYRAQYCVSVEHGSSQNRRLVEALAPLCLAFAAGQESEDFPMTLVAASLAGTDAKLWINDADVPNLDQIHIDYPPWVAKAQAAATGTPADQAARGNATSGVLAPVSTHIELKGAWITPTGEEWRDPAKARRSEEIRDYGYT
jgi:hypothetical protein